MTPPIYIINIYCVVKLTVRYASHPWFKGFFFQARAPNSNVAIGSWKMLDPDNQLFVNCSGPRSALSHNSHSLKNMTKALWNAPCDYSLNTVNILYRLNCSWELSYFRLHIEVRHFTWLGDKSSKTTCTYILYS